MPLRLLRRQGLLTASSKLMYRAPQKAKSPLALPTADRELRPKMPPIFLIRSIQPREGDWALGFRSPARSLKHMAVGYRWHRIPVEDAYSDSRYRSLTKEY